MRRQWIVYAFWLLLAACLYFFENNMGTRAVLICSLLFPVFPALRSSISGKEDAGKEKENGQQTVSTFIRQETDEPGDIRPYRPGDPVRRIHWKLSAKKGDILIRETQTADEPAEKKNLIAPTRNGKKDFRKILIRILTAVIVLCLLMLVLIPETRRGSQALCNRVFTASEAVNAYAYTYFPVPENQNVFPAAFLLLLMAASLIILTVLLRSRFLILGIAAALTVFQVYFGIAFPAWINIPVYGLLAALLLNLIPSDRRLKVFAALILTVSVLCVILLPGVDAATEAASETVRDNLSGIVQQFAGKISEAPEGETETRHAHTQSLETGNQEAAADQEYRLVTVEEEQISMPHWVNYMKIILLLLLAAALVILPFTPFLLLNSRRKKADEARKTFLSADVSQAVRAIFQRVIDWLEATGSGAGNLLYRDWTACLPDSLPEGYAARFSACAADFEEAVYSGHVLPEEKRKQALDLLKETEDALWQKADRKQRFRLKYWMCLCE